ncbi:hypothetical protein K5D41_21345, partial [Pseudomonas cichorii]|nr:hypothetical protein [Pseudomonas cichorii]
SLPSTPLTPDITLIKDTSEFIREPAKHLKNIHEKKHIAGPLISVSLANSPSFTEAWVLTLCAVLH